MLRQQPAESAESLPQTRYSFHLPAGPLAASEAGEFKSSLTSALPSSWLARVGRARVLLVSSQVPSTVNRSSRQNASLEVRKGILRAAGFAEAVNKGELCAAGLIQKTGAAATAAATRSRATYNMHC